MTPNDQVSFSLLIISAIRVHFFSVPVRTMSTSVTPRTSPPPQYTTITDTKHDMTPRKAFAFDDMQEALDAFARGEFLVVMDDESRENEGDLIIAADKITTEKMAWFIKHTRYARAAV